MRLLLDSHAFLWWTAGDRPLSRQAALAISQEPEVFVSAATIWELSIKQAVGKLQLPGDLISAIEEQDFRRLPVTVEHAAKAGGLPLHHRDPFDRMLVAQALHERMTIVTSDKRIPEYDVEVLWAT